MFTLSIMFGRSIETQHLPEVISHQIFSGQDNYKEFEFEFLHFGWAMGEKERVS